jgi:hypothetical protein
MLTVLTAGIAWILIIRLPAWPSRLKAISIPSAPQERLRAAQVNFQEVVHSLQAVNADVATHSDSRIGPP